jgi:hypothetical protein
MIFRAVRWMDYDDSVNCSKVRFQIAKMAPATTRLWSAVAKRLFIFAMAALFVPVSNAQLNQNCVATIANRSVQVNGRLHRLRRRPYAHQRRGRVRAIVAQGRRLV